MSQQILPTLCPLIGKFNYPDNTNLPIFNQTYNTPILNSAGLPVLDLSGNVITKTAQKLVYGLVVRVITPIQSFTVENSYQDYTIDATSGFLKLSLYPNDPVYNNDASYYWVEFYLTDITGRTNNFYSSRAKWTVPNAPNATTITVTRTAGTYIDPLGDYQVALTGIVDSTGLINYVPNVDFTYNEYQIFWYKPYTQSFTVSSGTTFTLTTAPTVNALNKVVTITRNGLSYKYDYGTYWTISGNTLNWTGTGALAIQSGDTLVITWNEPSTNRPPNNSIYTVSYTPAIDIATISDPNQFWLNNLYVYPLALTNAPF